MIVLNGVLVALGAAGSLAAVGVYGLSTRWWRNPIGRFLVGQGALIAIIYVRAIARLVGHHWQPPLPITPAGLAVNALVAALEISQAGTFAWVIVKVRRELRRELADTAPEGDGGLRD